MADNLLDICTVKPMNPPWRLEGLKPSQWFWVAFLLKRDPGLCTAPATGTWGEQRPLRGPQGEAWFPVRGFLEGAPVVRNIEKSFKIQEIQPSNLSFKLWVVGLSPGVFLKFSQRVSEALIQKTSFFETISGMCFPERILHTLRSKAPGCLEHKNLNGLLLYHLASLFF